MGHRFSVAAFAGASIVVAGFAALDCANPGPCSRNSECDVGYYCSPTKGTCVRNCVDATRDCEPGQVCDVNGQCATPSADGGTPDAVVTDDAPTNDTSTQDVVTVTDTSTQDVVTTGTKIELDLCASDTQCKTGLICRALYKGGPTRCAPTCTQNAQCRAGARCLTIGADTYCADADVGNACSTQNPVACNYACVSSGYCTIQCLSGSDCPNGYGCATVQNQKVCVRAEEYCGGVNNCTLDCDTSGLVSSCTLPCSGASDCPQRASILSPWTCSTYCKRPADVYGPLAQGDTVSWACNVSNQEVNVCNDAQHADFVTNTIPSPPSITCPNGNQTVDGQADDICVDSCRYSGACAFGYECTGVGDISNTRIDVCTPAHGNGEVGASCSYHGDCAFGYCSASNKCGRDCSADGICPTGSTCTAVGGNYPDVEGIAFKVCQ